ncbi:MAG: LacI family DNA-binding transcriptional regulator [Rhodospirillales bacterium]|nr:LacI family DNA-binding transcriptional regulator [Rhodospirillales bacterium]
MDYAVAMTDPAPSARLEDVARLAGVSIVTASRALRQPEKVAVPTRERIAAAAASLGYVPNLVAGALASARSGVIAVLLPTITSSIFASTIDGLTQKLEAEGYAILMAQSGYDATREQHVLTALLGRRPEGVVLIGSPMSEPSRTMLAAASRGGMVVIETWELPADPIDVAVGFDNGGVGTAAAAHLLGQGRRELGFLGGNDSRARTRWQAFRRAAEQAGAVAVAGEFAAPATMDDVVEAHRAGTLPPGLLAADGIFASNDVHAVGMLSVLRQAGRRVPDDVALIGLGDLAIGRHVVPALTTIAIDGYEIGRLAACAFLARRRGEAVGHSDVGFTILRRESG